MNAKIRKIFRSSNVVNAIVLFVMVCGFSMNASAREKIRLTTGEWAPYISQGAPHQGLFTQITTEAFALQGVDVELGFFPWQRVYQLSKSGEWDGTIAYAKTTEREKYYTYSDPVYTGKYVFFHLKSYPMKWQTYSDLNMITIAATRGFGGMGQEFIDAENSKVIKVERLASDVQSFQMLLLNRVQAVASDMEVGYALIHKLFGSEKSILITHNDHLIQYAKYHLVLSKNSKRTPELIKKFNLGLAALKQSGRYNQIIKEFYQDRPGIELNQINFTMNRISR